jgi:hypothetical protein
MPGALFDHLHDLPAVALDDDNKYKVVTEVAHYNPSLSSNKCQ